MQKPKKNNEDHSSSHVGADLFAAVKSLRSSEDQHIGERGLGELTKAAEQEARKRPEVVRLMTHPGVVQSGCVPPPVRPPPAGTTTTTPEQPCPLFNVALRKFF
jgi:hypothetical protein